MGLGWALEADGNLYLLLGIPITAGFQLLISRRPLHTLWVRDAVQFRLGRPAIALATAIAAAPIASLARYLAGPGESPEWVRVAWLLSAAAGGVGAAFAFRHFSRATVRLLLACAATAGTFGVALMVAARLARPVDSSLTAGAALTALWWFLVYLPVAFVLEEVFFRGALDAHVHRGGDSHGVRSAVFVSALWGLWHLPVAPAHGSVVGTVSGLLVVHLVIGIPLSLYWRRSGNLAVPATTHAFVDAVRNTLLL